MKNTKYNEFKISMSNWPGIFFFYFALINKGALGQALEIIFEVRRNRINGKLIRRKIKNLTYNDC
jgi:hypothetical protein